MSSNPRREFVTTAAALSCTWVAGCGGGEGTDSTVGAAPSPPPDPTPNPPPPAPPAPPPLPQPLPASPTGKYRTGQKYLFQAVPAKLITTRLPDGRDLLWDIYGPTYTFVDFHTGWRWSKGGGDWIDRDKVRYGANPWFTVITDKVLGNTASASYTADIGTTLQFVQTENRWCAFSMVAKNASRKMAGLGNPDHAAPSIDVVYTNGQRARLACRMIAGVSGGSISPNTTSAEYNLPVFIEFDRPESAVASAQLNFVVTQHWSGANPTLQAFLLDPPVTPDVGPTGVSATAGRLDEGITDNASVIGAHRYVDGTTLADFAHNGDRNYSAERNFDPAIYGTGSTDLTKYPHAGLGKWVNADPNWSVVASSYTGEGFAPLAPGLGALRIHMPKHPTVTDGSLVGYGGTLAGNGMIFLPEHLFGLLDRIFVRYYFRLGTEPSPLVQQRYQVYNSVGAADWTTQAGKFGIGPDHTTSYGGVSGSSGGGYGWQMRLIWAECDAGTAGPDEGGWATGFHLYDFNFQNPPGHNYGQTQASADERWGQRGGSGGMLYSGRWYCIETELKLNTVSAAAPGWTPDGELRAWIDGRQVYERTGMVFRTLPLVSQPYVSTKIRPCRELGVRGLWLNWFHGGKTVATIDRTSFYSGLVWGKEYIGPMRL
jgi:hypothetical protein